MRTRTWLFLPLLAAIFLVLAACPDDIRGQLNYVWAYWWVFPFLSSVVSVFLSVGNIVLGKRVPFFASGNLLSGAYLVVGPSLALLGVSSSLGIALPTSLDYVTPAMLPASAWAYYKSLGPSEEDGIMTSRVDDHPTEEAWGKSA